MSPFIDRLQHSLVNPKLNSGQNKKFHSLISLDDRKYLPGTPALQIQRSSASKIYQVDHLLVERLRSLEIDSPP
jgi:hypothetical protein